MDDETREALSTIIGIATKPRSVKRARTKTEIFARYKDIKYTPAAAPEPSAGYDFFVSAIEETQAESAVLCINTAKACVVLRIEQAPYKMIRHLEEWIYHKKATPNTTDKVIEIHPSLLPKLKQVLKENYRDVHVIGAQKQIQATKFDKLIAALDKEDNKKIYSLLARKYHPDLPTGNKEIMTLINLVFKGGN